MADDAELARLAARDYQVYVETYRDAPGVDVRDVGGIRLRLAPGIGDDYLTGVFGAVLAPEEADRRIAEIIAAVDGEPFHWSVWPTDEPADLPERLVRAGFEDVGRNPLMTYDLEALGDPEPPPVGLEIREALDTATRSQVAAYATEAVGWNDDGRENPYAATFLRLAEEPSPRMRIFGGWLDGELVSCAELFTGSGLAGIYAVATTEAVRGRGFGRALTLAAMHAGRDEGRRLAVLMASDLGEPVYRRIGYRDVGEVRFFRWPGAI